jgi:hypothetical protein
MQLHGLQAGECNQSTDRWLLYDPGNLQQIMQSDAGGRMVDIGLCKHSA